MKFSPCVNRFIDGDASRSRANLHESFRSRGYRSIQPGQPVSAADALSPPPSSSPLFLPSFLLVRGISIIESRASKRLRTDLKDLRWFEKYIYIYFIYIFFFFAILATNEAMACNGNSSAELIEKVMENEIHSVKFVRKYYRFNLIKKFGVTIILRLLLYVLNDKFNRSEFEYCKFFDVFEKYYCGFFARKGDRTGVLFLWWNVRRCMLKKIERIMYYLISSIWRIFFIF